MKGVHLPWKAEAKRLYRLLKAEISGSRKLFLAWQKATKELHDLKEKMNVKGIMIGLVALGLVAFIPSCGTTTIADQATFEELNRSWTTSIGPRFKAYVEKDATLGIDLKDDLLKEASVFWKLLQEAATKGVK
jgi:hypothetical protein